VSERSRARPEPWLIHFFQRDARDDKAQRVPAIDFLEQVRAKVRAEMQAVLEAVAEAPPPAFSGGGKWEVMHDDMASFYEVRVRGADRRNHRLFCILEQGSVAAYELARDDPKLASGRVPTP
jgi:hypothetical protein